VTTGNKTWSAVYFNSGPTPPAGTYKLGRYTKKVWTGTDYPPAKPVYTNVYIKPKPAKTVTYWAKVVGSKRKQRITKTIQPASYAWDIDTSNGFMTYKKLISSRMVVRRKWVKPPKRARVEQHAYSVSGGFTTNLARVRTRKVLPTVQAYEETGNTYMDTNHGGSIGLNADPWTANDDLALLGKLRDEIAGSSFNPAVFLAEGHHSLAMIFDSATRIYSAYRSARKGNLRKAARALTDGYTRRVIDHPKVPARNWLELQYGWLPLLQDAEEGAQFLAHQFSVPLQYRVSVRRNANGRHSDNPLVVNWDIGHPGSLIPGTYKRSQQIIAYLKEKDMAVLSGLMDPASVAWELMPYSFVIDWFIPIGNYLSGLATSRALTGTFVTTSIWEVNSHGPLVAKPQWEIHPSDNGYFLNRKDYKFTRTVSTSLQVPCPETKPLGKVASMKHTLNALALLTNLTKF